MRHGLPRDRPDINKHHTQAAKTMSKEPNSKRERTPTNVVNYQTIFPSWMAGVTEANKQTAHCPRRASGCS